jgi:hypothetical protein
MTQKVARRALVEFCEDFEEDIEFTPARFFPVPNQTTPTWCEKVRDLEEINPQALEYTGLSTVRYLHALDLLYEDQQRKLTGWINKYKDQGDELYKTTMELYKSNGKRAILQRELVWQNRPK